MKIIDTHTHCFPDFLAEHAIQKLSQEINEPYYQNGTLKGLLLSMDEAGIEKAIIQSIATKPEQTENILKWSLEIRSERIEPFLSIHPLYQNYHEFIKIAKDNDFKGIKFHPHYQQYKADDENVFPLYEALAKNDLIVFFHAGRDLAFPGFDNASVPRLHKVITKFPEMKTILAHFGAYREWDEVYNQLAGLNVYFETSFMLEEKGNNLFLKIIKKHSVDKILFGTDSPWTNQKRAVELIQNSPLSQEDKEKIFYKNTEKLIKL